MTVGRFWQTLGLTVLGLSLLSLGVVWIGDRTEPRPISVQPLLDERDVPATSALTLRFSRPVTRDAVVSALSVVPPLDGTVEVDRLVARFVPRGGLQSGAEYTVMLRAGLTDTTGRVLRSDYVWRFWTRPARLVFSAPEGDGSEILAPRNLWVASLVGGPARRLTSEPLGILFVSLDATGERMAYSAPNPAAPNASGLWSARLDGSGHQPLTSDLDSAILSVAWSPRGDLIAYERRPILGEPGQPGRPRILGIRPDGGGGGLLYGRGDDAGAQPVWSPDGRRLLVADTTGGVRTVVDLTGDVVRIPTRGLDSGAWSPDGQLIATADLVESPAITRSVVTIADRTGQILRRLDRTGFSDTAPAWSPDGRAIAVIGSSVDTGDTDIWLHDPDGTASSRIALPTAEGPSQLTPPVWSAGGDLLAWTRLVTLRGAAGRPPRTVWELWVADGDGGNPRRLPVDGLAEAWAP